MAQKKNLKFYNKNDLEILPQFQSIPKQLRDEIRVVAKVLPFRTNNYVIEELIDWSNIPDDPIFQLNFVQKDMLDAEDFEKMAEVLNRGGSTDEIKHTAAQIRYKLNPHPAGQLTANVPTMNDEPVPGVQHKYYETALIFPSSGQTCHAYCTFCFRWAQFVGMTDLKFATDESKKFQEYIKTHKEITDVLLTGGDPMIMSAQKLQTYIEPLLGPGFEHIRNIRIGTKAIAYWPYRFVTDPDADDILRLFERIFKAGKHTAIMAHFNHWVELSTPIAQEAIRRIRNTGAGIRTQSPMIKHINDDYRIWVRMWKEQVKNGCVPYYTFIERDTGAAKYFSIPLAEVFEIFNKAYINVSGIHRTARGPVMSTTPGKIRIDGISEINGEKVFVLTILRGRNREWVRRPFFAKYDETSTWLDQLKPAFGEEKFFFEDELKEILAQRELKIEKSLYDLHHTSPRAVVF
ncbi:MAG: lysine 2,3-aminomutase [bacterium]